MYSSDLAVVVCPLRSQKELAGFKVNDDDDH